MVNNFHLTNCATNNLYELDSILGCRLGGTPLMELMIAARKAVKELQVVHGLAVDRVYTGSFMTSLDMAGTIASYCVLFSFLFFISVLSLLLLHFSCID